MTQADFNSKYGRLSMPCPFGNNDSANITQIAGTAAAGDFNFETGFATPYSSPKSNGGKFVTRKEMNAIGNLASRNDFYHSCGGINTFDTAIADAINGYPKGAVLDYLMGYKLYSVISLVDGNKVNFISDGVDGVNWQYLNSNIPEIGDEPVEIGNVISSVSTSMEAVPLSVLRAKKTGIVTISSVESFTGANASAIKSYTTNTGSGVAYTTNEFYGNALAYKILTSDELGSITYPTPSSMGDWKIMPAQGFTSGGIATVSFTGTYFSGGSTSVSSAITSIAQYSTSIPIISKGNYIAFCYLCGNAQGTEPSVSSKWSGTTMTSVTATYASFCLLFNCKMSIS